MYFRLKNEIEIQSRLRFTHICLLYCYFHDVNNVYLVLEYCPNKTLYHLSKYTFNQSLNLKKMVDLTVNC